MMRKSTFSDSNSTTRCAKPYPCSKVFKKSRTINCSSKHRSNNNSYKTSKCRSRFGTAKTSKSTIRRSDIRFISMNLKTLRSMWRSSRWPKLHVILSDYIVFLVDMHKKKMEMTVLDQKNPYGFPLKAPPLIFDVELGNKVYFKVRSTYEQVILFIIIKRPT